MYHGFSTDFLMFLALSFYSRLLVIPALAETKVIDLLVGMGYGGTIEDAGQRLGKSGDGGIDGIIKEDRLGLDVIYMQAKK